MKTLFFLLIVSPLVGAALNAVAGRVLPRRAVEAVACLGVGVSFAASLAAIALTWGTSVTIPLADWISVGDFHASFDAYATPLSTVMAVMVTFVSTLIHVYSVGYMREDEDYVRYFCYLNLFVFSMLTIVMADNLVFLFLGWEGVGFCSYALIGFWYADVENAMAGRKAFLLTRIGDVAFCVALGLVFVYFGGFSLAHIETASASTLSTGTAALLGALFLWAAAGKSAQLPLSVWLPDAMAGPTPVSALIHAATMVTAGVYLLMRLFPVLVLSPGVMEGIAVVGVLTAFYGACSALVQKDFKRVLAYSTISQVGYMLLALGARDVIGSMFFLLTHAAYKALLFLAAGCVIQALHEERNIHRMGKVVRRALPDVYWTALAGFLALAAVVPTAGYVSKDRVLLAAFAGEGMLYHTAWALGTVTAFLTAVYAFRLFFLVFTGKPAEEVEEGRTAKPVPRIMVWVLVPLALLALGAGWLNFPKAFGGNEWLSGVLESVPGAVPLLGAGHEAEWRIAAGDAVISFAGAVFAFLLFGPVGALRRHRFGHFLSAIRAFAVSGFGLDVLYDRLFVRPYRALSRFFWTGLDETGVDGGLVAMARSFVLLGTGLRRWSTGRISTALVSILVGFTVILLVLAVRAWSR